MSTLLAILIGLAQVAGPWLCCCRPVAAAAVPTDVPAPAPSGCPHCRAAAKTPAAPGKPARPAEQRHCCARVLSVAAVPTDAAADWLRLLALAGPAFAAAGGSFVDAVRGPDLAPWVAGASELPFLTAAARLYAHHVLRC